MAASTAAAITTINATAAAEASGTGVTGGGNERRHGGGENHEPPGINWEVWYLEARDEALELGKAEADKERGMNGHRAPPIDEGKGRKGWCSPRLLGGVVRL
ncbi:hypothetical protein PR202_gb04045 [Eleusine coracana subsp. coracana]|uniref:Uncharacterized protein n=1 Tax=Eleusine coracana subsp. coracana TaxID=191504 RepID=A0AAV5E3K5_ELECO|nr:hypothetical protein PR202_gb04045 [Eleusine coracana subsp. coracana]